MNTHNLGISKIGDTLPARIDGIDVDQLLHDLGEASASANPVDLFGLCLRAQRVLAMCELPSASRRQITG